MSIGDRGQVCLGRTAVEVLLGQFGKWPLKAAADAIGVNPETWRNWKDGTSRPNTDHLTALFKRFGPKFIAYVTAPFEESYLDLQQARIDAQIKQLLHERSALETHGSGLRDLAAASPVGALRLVAKSRGETET